MKVKIELVKSPIGYKYDQRETANALGLKKMHDCVVVEQTPQISGMIRKISHLVRVEQVQ